MSQEKPSLRHWWPLPLAIFRFNSHHILLAATANEAPTGCQACYPWGLLRWVSSFLFQACGRA